MPREQPGGIPGYGPPRLLPVHQPHAAVCDEARARNRESLGDEVPHAAPPRAASSCHAGRGQARRAGLPSWSAPGAESFSSALMGPDRQGPECVSEGRAGVHMQLPECGCSLFLE